MPIESGDSARRSNPCASDRVPDEWAKQREKAHAIADESRHEIASAQGRCRRLISLSTLLGVLATVFAAIAALTVLPDDIGRWVTAGCAFASAVTTGVTTTINPAQRAHRALMKYVGWTRLFDEAQRFDRWLDTPEDKASGIVERKLKALEQHRGRIVEEEETGSDRGVRQWSRSSRARTAALEDGHAAL